MKRAFILIITILILSLFNINNIYAEEYNDGDLVEIIHPTGGETLKYYIYDLNEDKTEYFLTAVKPFATEMSLNEVEVAIVDDEYVFGYPVYYEDKIETQDISFLQDITVPIYLCIDNYTNIETLSEETEFSCPKLNGDFDNSFVLFLQKHVGGEVKYFFQYLKKKENTESDYILKTIVSDTPNFEELDTIKLNYYAVIAIEQQNMGIVKKVVKPEVVSTSNNEQVTSSDIECDEKENPKTGDKTLLIGTSIMFIAGFTLFNTKRKFS